MDLDGRRQLATLDRALAEAITRLSHLERNPGNPQQGQLPSSVAVGSGTATVAVDGTVTFTGASRVSLNDIFDGLGADLYEIVANLQSSTAAFVSTNLRASGTDITAANYDFTGTNTSLSAGPTRASGTGRTTSGYWVPVSSGAMFTLGTMRIANPALAAQTLYELRSLSSGAGDRILWNEGGSYSATTAADGLSIVASAGTITGWIKVVKIA